MNRIIRVTKCAECPHCDPRVMYSQRATERVQRTVGYECAAWHKAYLQNPESIPEWCPLEKLTVDTAAKP